MSARIPTNVLHLTEVLPAGWKPIPIDDQYNAGRVIRVRIEGRPEQVATVGMASSDGWYRVYLPDTDEYVDCVIEWVEESA